MVVAIFLLFFITLFLYLCENQRYTRSRCYCATIAICLCLSVYRLILLLITIIDLLIINFKIRLTLWNNLPIASKITSLYTNSVVCWKDIILFSHAFGWSPALPAPLYHCRYSQRITAPSINLILIDWLIDWNKLNVVWFTGGTFVTLS